MKSFYIPFLLVSLLFGPWGLNAQNAGNAIATETKPPIIQMPIYPQQAEVANGGIMTLEEETHDFGQMEQGGDASWTFKFTNTGTEAITIDQIKPSCSCTTPRNWPREPIQPGQTGEISVIYDSNHVGNFNKRFTIESNASAPTKVLAITGTLVPKPVEPTYFAPIEGSPVRH